MSGIDQKLTIPGRVVVFDYGEVLSTAQSEDDKASLLSTAGASGDEFWPAYWKHRDDLDAGAVTIAHYWQRVGSELGLPFDAVQLQRLWALDFRSWLSVDPGSIDILADLHAGGTRTALLSNAGRDYGSALRNAPFAAYLEQVFVSAEIGIVKPDPEIFRHIARELGIEPAQLVFVDNKKVNVEGAESVGGTGYHFVGAAELRSFLNSLAEGGTE